MTQSPRLYKNTVQGVIDAIQRSFTQSVYAHKVVAEALKSHKKWGSRDRSFVAFSTYEIVRHWRFLWALLDEEPQPDNQDKLYTLFGVWWLFQGHTLPDWSVFATVKNFDIDAAHEAIPSRIEIIESFPDWLHQLATQQLGNQWPEIAAALNTPAPLCLRINTLKAKHADVLKHLQAEGYITQSIPNFPDALCIENAPKITKHPLFDQGFFEVQDAGSQAIAPFLNPQPGSFVIDACAGAGGKTLHLAALMQNTGKIVALDVFPKKLLALKMRAKRAGAKIIDTETWNKNTLKKLNQKADYLLLDVPCSGTGVIKRDVDTKWKLTQTHLDKNIATQRKILTEYTQMLKPGGTFVYATCSILQSENEMQANWFLQNFGIDFEMITEKRINPTTETDGFYMAKFVRKMS